MVSNRHTSPRNLSPHEYRITSPYHVSYTHDLDAVIQAHRYGWTVDTRDKIDETAKEK